MVLNFWLMKKNIYRYKTMFTSVIGVSITRLSPYLAWRPRETCNTLKLLMKYKNESRLRYLILQQIQRWAICNSNINISRILKFKAFAVIIHVHVLQLITLLNVDWSFKCQIEWSMYMYPGALLMKCTDLISPIIESHFLPH